jgi:hypothetical protein
MYISVALDCLETFVALITFYGADAGGSRGLYWKSEIEFIWPDRGGQWGRLLLPVVYI